MKQEILQKFIIGDSGTVVEALERLDAGAKGILFVTDGEMHLLGALTDGDIRRWLLKTGNLKGLVRQFMNKSPKSLYETERSRAREFMMQYSITAIPIVAASGEIRDILFLNETGEGKKIEASHSLSDVPVVIMAGGKGTRLYPYTKILPKPLIPIGDVPIMERIIRKFLAFGARDFYAAVNYRKSMIKAYFSEAAVGYRLAYIEEPEPLGTAGSLSLLEQPFGKPFFVTNCDILINTDYEELYKYHLESGNVMTMVTALKNLLVPYGVVHSKENGAIVSLEEKPKLSYFVNTGMYVLNPEAAEEIPKHTFYHITDLAEKLMAQGKQVGTYPISEESFLDMGEFEEMRRMEEKLSKKSE
jgi:dTDP-glucose pyrophosphorylase